MEKYLIKTEQKIKELNKIVSVKEWNRIAQQENLLCNTTIVALTGIPFSSYCRKIRKS